MMLGSGSHIAAISFVVLVLVPNSISHSDNPTLELEEDIATESLQKLETTMTISTTMDDAYDTKSTGSETQDSSFNSFRHFTISRPLACRRKNWQNIFTDNHHRRPTRKEYAAGPAAATRTTTTDAQTCRYFQKRYR